MARKSEKKEEFDFKTTHDLAEYLIKLAEYIKSLPNVQLVQRKQMRTKVENEKIREKIEKFEKEIEGKSLEDIRQILLRKTKKELEEIARGYKIPDPKNMRKNELIDVIIDNLRFPEKFEKLRKG